MDLGLAGKTVLVTGASRGIGRACALGFAEEGCRLHLAARDKQTLDDLARAIAERYPDRAPTVHALDLSEPLAGARLVEALGGEIDVLVNNAGAAPGGDILEVGADAWRKAWDLKVYGYIDTARKMLEYMWARRGGVIVNVIGGGVLNRGDYTCGTSGNAALTAFTNSAGAKSADFGVRVVGVHPGTTATDRLEQLNRARAQAAFGDAERWREMDPSLPFGRPADPREVADAVVYLASARASYVTGECLRVDGGRPHR